MLSEDIKGGLLIPKDEEASERGILSRPWYILEIFGDIIDQLEKIEDFNDLPEIPNCNTIPYGEPCDCKRRLLVIIDGAEDVGLLISRTLLHVGSICKSVTKDVLFYVAALERQWQMYWPLFEPAFEELNRRLGVQVWVYFATKIKSQKSASQRIGDLKKIIDDPQLHGRPVSQLHGRPVSQIIVDALRNGNPLVQRILNRKILEELFDGDPVVTNIMDEVVDELKRIGTSFFDKQESIIGHVSEVLQAMSKDEFDTHEFILELAQRYQKEYIQSLACQTGSNPFQALHSKIGKAVKSSDLVDEIIDGNDHRSPNIFGSTSSCSKWRKI